MNINLCKKTLNCFNKIYLEKFIHENKNLEIRISSPNLFRTFTRTHKNLKNLLFLFFLIKELSSPFEIQGKSIQLIGIEFQFK